MTATRTKRLRPQAEHGFTLASVMGLMLVASMICLAAFNAANGDVRSSADNRDRKVAYAAAESGVAWYQAKLTGDPNYWQDCDEGTTDGVPDAVNQPNVAEAARKWQTVTGTGPNRSEFSVGMLPAAPATTCSTTDATSMLSSVDGSFKVRVTGRYRGQRRTIVTSFRRQRFLNFIYFTDYETLDYTVNGAPSTCQNYRALRPASCTVIQFASQDKVNGPLHTNDDIIYCGSPTFGRGPGDSVTVSGPAPGYTRNTSCGASGTPNFQGGILRHSQRALQMPPTNAALRTLTTAGFGGAGYRLSGTQYIRFNGNGTMTVDSPARQAASQPPQTVSLPTNGVIYVDPGAGPCNNAGSPQQQPYNHTADCANAYVSGTADRSVTVAAQKDIIVAPTTNSSTNRFNPATADSSWTDANLIGGSLDTSDAANHKVTGPVQIGLIATGFVRVYHRVTSFDASATLASGVRDVRIDAAILSLQHSFIVDNWGYAASPGKLSVYGAIAQRFRGPVGTGSGATISTGYLKDYWYDNRLRFRSPPHFLDPVNAAWGVGRQNELVPPV